MIVVEKYKLLFSHLPKAGGSALLRGLIPHLTSKEVDYTKKGWQVKFHVCGMHAPFTRSPWVINRINDGWRYGCVVRPPWSRLCSLYRKVKPDVGFERFVKHSNLLKRVPFIDIPTLTDMRCTDWLRYEHMQEDLDNLCTLVGAPFIDVSKRANHTEDQTPDKEICTKGALEWISRRYAVEINYFNWKQSLGKLMDELDS